MSYRGSWRKRRRLKRRLAVTEHCCWLCGKPLDFSLPRFHPEAVEIDEEIPVSKGGNPLDRKNCHLVHRSCNLAKGAKVLRQGALADSREDSPQPSPSRIW